jgi:Protein of unknown function (DUF4238)
MAVQSTEGTHHHYVPQFLLRGFAPAKRKHVHVFDKSNEKEFRSPVRHLACQRDFYNPEVDRWLTQLEDTSAPIIQSIRMKRVLTHLQKDEIQWLAAFIAVQHVRTLHHRALFADMNAQMADAIREMGTDPNTVKNFREWTESEYREFANAEVARTSFVLLPYILNKAWILCSAAPGNEFWIGDHPVTLDNNMNPGDSLRSTLGFGVAGIEIYLPISSQSMLGCLCPSIRAFAQSHAGQLPRALDFVKAFEGSTTLEVDAENVKRQNSLQVIYAERFVFSEHGAFDMVRQMIASDENLRRGLRTELVGRRRRKQTPK